MSSQNSSDKPTPFSDAIDKRVEDAMDRKLRWIEGILNLMQKHGVSAVALVVVTWFFAIPIRDGHLEYLHRTADSQLKTGEAVEKTSEAVDAIRDVVVETSKANVELRAIADDHYSIAKETSVDVKAIKAAIIPSPTGPMPHN